MNREIKFRGKRLDNGEWVYGDLLHLVDGVYISNDNGCNMAQVDPDTVCQFTGCIDKSGKEVYEGDVVETYSRSYIVTWFKRSSAFLLKEDGTDNLNAFTPSLVLQSSDAVVTGNDAAYKFRCCRRYL